MPTYDYACPDCGPFEAIRPVAAFRDPCACVTCGALASRVLLAAPGLASMDSGRRAAFATNERSASAPAQSRKTHPSGCGCCKPGKATLSADTVPAKGFPASRPWMISH